MRHIVITISEYYLDRLNSLAESLREEGLTITRLYEFGVIIGFAEDELIMRIRNHEGIVSLTEEKQIDIPPPDSDIQ
ncbi:MAG: hypothetical protein PHC39_11615 [Proteiniphilum sp.]|nr:hypothetical protein [Proteiniphilum sp.]